MNTSPRFFLGTSSGVGFTSLYGELAREDDLYIYYIKGTPGSGKSTFMRTVAREAEALGLTVEYILCSGDPDSLDGIIIPERRLAYVDATAPHAQEPEIPGVTGEYLPLGAFRESVSPADCAALRKRKSADALCRRRASAYLAALSALIVPALSLGAEARLPDRRADALISEGSGFREKRRFLSAITANGDHILEETLAGAERVFLSGGEAMETVRALCRERKQAITLCPYPFCPDITEAVLVPACHTVFLNEMCFSGDGGTLSRPKADKILPMLFSVAAAELAEATRLHGEIETIYRSYLCFEENDRLLEKHIRALTRHA